MRKEKGITLIALVITIIVLLILAGVSISLVLGNNGILTQASKAVLKTNEAKVQEQLEMEVASWITEKYAGSGKSLSDTLDNTKYDVVNNGDGTYKVTDKETGYEFTVEDNGKVISEGKTLNETEAGNNREETQIIGNGTYSEEKGVNTPVKTADMTPKYFDTNNNTWKTATNENQWYNYTSQQWANMQTADQSWWVWIPRYAYKITTPYTSTSSTIEIRFLVGTTNLDKDGNDYTSGYNGFRIHPAFQNGTSKKFINGEWDREIAGIWVAKYEMSGERSTNSGVTWSYDVPRKCTYKKCRE